MNFDLEVLLSKYLFRLKEQEKKEYNQEECKKNVVYVFEDMNDFRNYFISNGIDNVDDEILELCKIKISKKGHIVAFKGLCDHYISAYKEKTRVKRLKETYNTRFEKNNLKSRTVGKNNMDMRDNLISFYPPNDVMAIMPIYFYDNNRHIINNQAGFPEIINLDDILIQMVDIYDKSLDNGDVIDSYGFMLELTDEVKPNYHGRAKLIMTDSAFRDNLPDVQKEEARAYFTNRFLDHFMGWNFGVSINRNEELKNKLKELNDKVIDLGIRENAGPGFSVFGVEEYPMNGVQHYYLPTEKSKRL